MPKFGNYRALKPLNEPRRFEFIGLAPEGDPEPFIMFLPADELNPAFLDTILKRASDPNAALDATGERNAEWRQRQREIDMESMAECCVVDWGNVIDDNGKAVPCDAATALEFFQAIPQKEFDRARAFCVNLRNFTPAAATAKGGELGKPVRPASSGSRSTRRRATA